jgi:gamma-glutamylcysteine synthetase
VAKMLKGKLVSDPRQSWSLLTKQNGSPAERDNLLYSFSRGCDKEVRLYDDGGIKTTVKPQIHGTASE